MSRKSAREVCLKLLYQINFHTENLKEQIEILQNSIFEEKIHDDQPLKLSNDDIAYVNEVRDGCIANLKIIDAKIEEFAKGWTISRIAKVDIAILRLAIYEIIYMEDIPKQVSINEAVELCKKYSTEESSSFVNGILGKVEKSS